MLPIGPLMEEHRTIEKLMPLLRRAVEDGRRDGGIDLRLVEMTLDFIRTYADRCHHGKEEDILFVELDRKPLTPEHRKVMDELVEEHRQGRRAVRELAAAAESYARGDREALKVLIERLEWLAAFYPAHIEKEDKVFFLPAMDYLDEPERSKLLAAEHEFDRRLIHDIYREKVEGGRGTARRPRDNGVRDNGVGPQK